MPGTTSLADHALAFDRWLRRDALPLWAGAGFGPPEAGFQEALGPAATAALLPRRLRVQARQTWVFAQAGVMGWDGPWRERARAGLAVLETRYRRADGAYRTLVAADGAVLDEGDSLYDQAFVLLALAAVTAAGLADLAAAAADLLAGPLFRLGHPAGGYRETAGATPFQSNPLMHLLEAALAWEDLAPGAPWTDLADSLAELALARLFDGRRLGEYFDAQWRAAPGPAGRLFEPGHQFEWAWLLERWGLSRCRPDARATAAALYRAGGEGLDRERGVVVGAMASGGLPQVVEARLWPQTERLKAGLLLAARADAQRQDYLADAQAACAAISRYLDTPVPGLWRERQAPGGAFPDEPAPATSLYHLVCAFRALQASAPAA